MKQLLSLLIICLGFTVLGQNIPDVHIKFVNSFIKAVTSQNDKKLIKHMDKTYRKEQIAFLEGDKQQFVDEIFGGEDLKTGKYINPKLQDVEKIEVVEVIKLKDGTYTYVFKVNSGENSILSSLRLIKKGKKYGFEGAVG